MYKEKPLSVEEITFLGLIAQGKKKAESYIYAFPEKNLNDKTASVYATRLLKKPKCIAKLEELKTVKNVVRSALWSKDERLTMLRDIAESNVEKDPKISIQCIEVVNKLMGDYTTKIQVEDSKISYHFHTLTALNAAIEMSNVVDGEIVPRETLQIVNDSGDEQENY